MTKRDQLIQEAASLLAVLGGNLDEGTASVLLQVGLASRIRERDFLDISIEDMTIVMEEMRSFPIGDSIQWDRISDRFREEENCVHLILRLARARALSHLSGPETLVYPGTIPPQMYGYPSPGLESLLIVIETPAPPTNELYPLVIDGLVSGYPIQILSLYHSDADVIPPLPLRRAIVYSSEKDLFIEGKMTGFVSPRNLLILVKNGSEHERIEKAYDQMRALNPFFISQAADDKAMCAERWKEARVVTPPTLRMVRSIVGLQELAKTFGSRFIVQPIMGTEGQGVQVLDLLEDEIPAEYPPDQEERIIRPVIEGLRYHDPEKNLLLACDLRVNVFWDGTQYVAESGYFQVAGREGYPVSSRSHGGRLLKFHSGILERLVGGNEKAYPLSSSHWEKIREVSENAASVFGPGGLFGVDLKLVSDRSMAEALGYSLSDGEILPVVLDANPRPSGFAHSEYLPGHPMELEPGVTQALWNRIGKR